MSEIKMGQSIELVEEVTSDKSALAMGSGDLQVYSTPSMIALMEKASMQCIEANLKVEETSVGGAINIKHLKPSAIGARVRCRSQVISYEHPRVEFEVSAFEGEVVIGKGSHKRFIVNRNTFMGNL